MKIGQPKDLSAATTPPAAASAPAQAKAQQGAAATASRTANSAGVAVTVSTQVRSLVQAERANTPEIDMEKVNAVRTAIEQGTYQVNPEAIADKLLANAKEMLGPTGV